MASLTFLHSKKKKGIQRTERKSLIAETMKRLSPRSKCYSFSHSRVSRVQIFFLSASRSTWKSISLALIIFALVSHFRLFFITESNGKIFLSFRKCLLRSQLKKRTRGIKRIIIREGDYEVTRRHYIATLFRSSLTKFL